MGVFEAVRGKIMGLFGDAPIQKPADPNAPGFLSWDTFHKFKWIGLGSGVYFLLPYSPLGSEAILPILGTFGCLFASVKFLEWKNSKPVSEIKQLPNPLEEPDQAPQEITKKHTDPVDGTIVKSSDSGKNLKRGFLIFGVLVLVCLLLWAAFYNFSSNEEPEHVTQHDIENPPAEVGGL